MKKRTLDLLRMQGFCLADVPEASSLSPRARWTPFSCATAGALGVGVGGNVLSFGAALCPCLVASAAGLWIGSGWFFIALGVLTFTGGITIRSIYDRLYNLVAVRVLHRREIPPHGTPRRFGCAIGGIMYTASGIGFLTHLPGLAFVPALLMIVLATVAATTHWCFASALYHLIADGRKAAGSGVVPS
jgi:hypothetical protein